VFEVVVDVLRDSRRGGPARSRPEVAPPSVTSCILPETPSVTTGPRTSWAWLCPRRSAPRPSSATIAELSDEFGSLEAVYWQLDQERADAQDARRARAEAERDRVIEAIGRLSRIAEGERRFRAWLSTPLSTPDWVDGLGWPEPDEQQAGVAR
jgi:hypothetical protein